ITSPWGPRAGRPFAQSHARWVDERHAAGPVPRPAVRSRTGARRLAHKGVSGSRSGLAQDTGRGELSSRVTKPDRRSIGECTMAGRVFVAGAGVAGSCLAWWLDRYGYAVT